MNRDDAYIRLAEEPSPSEPAAAADRWTFSAKGQALAWISIAVGYLFCRTFFVWEKPFIALIFTFSLNIFGFIYYGKTRRPARSYFYPVSALILSLSLFFSGSGVLHIFVFIYILLSFFLFCHTGGKHALEKRAGTLYLFEVFKSVLIAPLSGAVSAFHAMRAGSKSRKIGKTLIFILIGCAVAVIPTVIVLKLLSYDSNFTGILEDLSSNIGDGVGLRLLSLLFGIPCGMFFFGALCGSDLDGLRDRYTAEHCRKSTDSAKIAPPLIGGVALIPIFFLYAVFIFAQREYFGALFLGRLPEAHTFSSFARDGFFKLCGAAVVNVVIAVLLRILTKNDKRGKTPVLVKAATAALSLITVVLCFTAVSQMLMYVSAYGLTRLRLYTLWFMILLAVIFLLAALAQFIPRLPFAATALCVFVLFFGALALPDTDAIIAGHNYDCYQNGTTDFIDIDYLYSLGDSALPTLLKLTREEGAIGQNASAAVRRYEKEYGVDVGFEDFSLPALKAKDAYEEWIGA